MRPSGRFKLPVFQRANTCNETVVAYKMGLAQKTVGTK